VADVSVTVVIPTIEGREHLLARALASVDAQERPPAAVLVETDVDRTGAAATRNRALAKVTTRYVAFCDDDDELLPMHLRVLQERAALTGADLVYPGMIAVGGRDPLACPVNNVLVNPYCVPFREEQKQHLLTVGNFIPITWLGRTDLIQQVGGFPEPWADPSKGSGRVEEDYGLLINLLMAGAQFVHVPVRTWRYFFHEANTGGRGTDTI
jgi:glycosyltransferase involved in cell wall biosynthesis